MTTKTCAVEASALCVEYKSPESLKVYGANARSHSKQQVRQIARSIERFGFLNSVLVDRSDTIIAGHGRVQAAKLLGMSQIPTILIEGLSAEEIRAYVIADNRLAELAGWDPTILALELQHLLTTDESLDVTVTGFSIPEIDIILEADDEASKRDPQDDFIQDLEGASTTQPGDLWQLGKHRLLCCSSLETSSFVSLMGKRRASVVFADPPYNVPIDGHATGNGSLKHRDFSMASGEMTDGEFSAFLSTVLQLLAQYSQASSVHYVCMDWRHAGQLLGIGTQVYDTLLNLCVWVKDNGGMGSFYRSQHELVFVFRSGDTKHRNNIELGKHGRNRTNVWKYPGVKTQSKQGDEGNLLALHPTVKPIAMVADALLDCSARGEIVLDPFLGSGTTLMAAERVGRICYGIEIDPLYVDTAVRRWQRHTGEQAVLLSTGETFAAKEQSAEVSHV